MDNLIKLTVKWSGKEYEIELTEDDTIEDLKNAIHKQTSVRPTRQKLLNLKLKGKSPEDSCKICQLKLKPGFKLMMMGSLEEDIAEASTMPEDMPEVVNDFDIEEEEEIAIEHQSVYLAKIEKRISQYEFKIFNQPREGKKLLVLDIDYTLFDHKSTAETGLELMRPFLHEFLTAAYEDYDIVIWSATSMKWIEEKMKILGVASNSNYKILFYLDYLAMISVYTTKYGLVNVKPLGVIWGKFSHYSTKNTIMLDDIRKNFIMNPRNGLKIRAYRQAHLNRKTDKELFRLSKYLKDLALNCTDFTSVDHNKWERYQPTAVKRGSHNNV